jgi:hypothetical protein
MKAKALLPISCRRLVVVAASTVGAAILPILPAQVTATSPANAPKSADVIELSPFTVNETLDRGYAAQETLAGIKNTLPSTSYVTPQGSRIATLPHSVVATRSVDGSHEYIHVLRAPTGTEEKTRERYVNVLQLPPPADGKEFAKAVLLRSGREAKLGQNEQGLRIEVPRHDAWDPIDTVIKLTVQANTKVTP